MKTAILRICAVATSFLLLTFSSPVSADPLQNKPAAVQTTQAPERFDGVKLYHEAFLQIRDLHIKLDSPEKIEKFSKEWEHKFDNSGELKTEGGTDRAILKMMRSLGQRFDYYFDREQTGAERDEVESSLTGIGATMRLSKLADIVRALPKDASKEDVRKAIAISSDNALEVVEPMENSPAEKAGLKPGDVIRRIDGRDLQGMQMEDAIKRIKGSAGSAVKLSIERKDDSGKTSSVELSITRAVVTVPDVKYQDLGGGVSYVKMRDFMSKNAVREMSEALSKAAKGKALIIDLRGNPGGSLPAVLNITAMLLEDGPVLITRTRNGKRIDEGEFFLNKNFVISTEPDDSDPQKTAIGVGKRPELLIQNEMPVIVLVDQNSASASEILAGALQHNRRALIVGMPTVGKGVGQTVVQLPFGRSMHVTSFEFIPGRTPNDWTGVVPEIRVEAGEEPGFDRQLEKAKEIILSLIKSAEETRGIRDEQFKKHHEDFDKVLKGRGN